MGTPSTSNDAIKRAMAAQLAGQLEMLEGALAEAPEKIREAAKNFKEALKEWAGTAPDAR